MYISRTNNIIVCSSHSMPFLLLYILCVLPPHTPSFLHTVTQETAPSIVAPPRSIRVQLGEPVNLTCTSTGVPTPSFVWFKDNTPVLGVVTPYYYIPSVGVNDRGYYFCESSNTRGTDRSQRALLSLERVQQYEAALIDSRRRRQTNNPAINMVRYESWRCGYVCLALSLHY